MIPVSFNAIELVNVAHTHRYDLWQIVFSRWRCTRSQGKESHIQHYPNAFKQWAWDNVQTRNRLHFDSICIEFIMSSSVSDDIHVHCTRSMSSPDVLVINDFRTLPIMQNIAINLYQRDGIWFLHVEPMNYCTANRFRLAEECMKRTTKQILSIDTW
jgi:hypothetical protein